MLLLILSLLNIDTCYQIQPWLRWSLERKIASPTFGRGKGARGYKRRVKKKRNPSMSLENMSIRINTNCTTMRTNKLFVIQNLTTFSPVKLRKTTKKQQ